MTKLISLEAENFKRLKAVRIEPNEKGITIISGANAAGKSSVLDAIQAAIGGQKVAPKQPIRTGEKKSTIIAELDDLIITRTFVPSGGNITVTKKDGSAPTGGTPQQILDKLFGALTFDPLAFARMKPKSQGEEVKRVAGLDLSDLEVKRDAAYQRRKDAKVLLKDRDAKVNSFSVVVETKRVDTDAISEQLRGIRDREDTASRLASRKVNLREEHDSIKGRIATLNEQLEKIVAEGKEVSRQLVDIEAVVDSPSKEELVASLDGMAEINAAAQAYEDYQVAVQGREEQAAVVKGFDDKLSEAREEISARIAQVEIPVTGMTITGDGLLLNDVPFSQASQAETIKASVEMGIGTNPELRLMLIRDGSLFDDDNLALLAKIAEDNDIQVLIERVGTGSEVGVVIEDGEVVQG
ncbi:MAG: AAA family ATPase [Planctomycetota bacterium]|nr:AAA family ATPase [Planctomycetota bacterium]